MNVRISVCVSCFSLLVLGVMHQPTQAVIVGEDDFQSYGNQNPAPDPLDGTLSGGLLWNYIDGQGDGIAANNHRTFISGGGGSAMMSTGWVSLENGGGIDTSLSLGIVAGTALDGGDGNIVADAPFALSFVVSAETSNTTSTIDFTYDVTSSGGSLAFTSGGNADNSVTLTSLNDSGTVTGGGLGKSDDRRFSISFTGTGLTTSDNIDFSFVRDMGINNPFVYFDDFVLEAIDGTEPTPRFTIDRDTGNISITNATISPIANVIGYSLLSDAGGLAQSNWDQQAGSSQLTGDNDDWTVLTQPGVATDLSEGIINTSGDGDGGDVAAVSGSWEFGNVWRKSPFEDIQIELLLDDGTMLGNDDFVVEYTGTEVTVGDIQGDGNGGPDGNINLVDWLELRSNINTDVSNLTLVEAYQQGDLDGDLVIGPKDFSRFVLAFDAANGVGAFTALATSVPEPAGSVLLITAGLAIVSVVRRGSRKIKMLERSEKRVMNKAIWTAMLSASTFSMASTAAADDFVVYRYDADEGNPANASEIQSPLDQGFLEWGFTQQGQTHDPALVIQEGIVHGGVNAYRNFDNGPTNPGWVTPLSDDVLQAMFDFGWKYEFTGVLVQGGHFSAWGVGAVNPWDTGGLGRIGVAYGEGPGTSEMQINPVGGGGTNVSLGDNTLNGDFVRVEITGQPQSLDYTFEVFDHNTNAQIGTTQNMSGFGGSNDLNSNVFGRQSGSSAGIGREALDHSFSLVVSEPATLTLEVNTTNGSMSLVNNSGENVSFNGYFVNSDGGALNPTGWNSLGDQNVDDPTPGNPDNGDGWEEFDAADTGFLGEGFLTGATSLADGQSFSLGSGFNTSIFGAGTDGDLSLVLTDELGRQIPSSLFSTVTYVMTEGVAGDYNRNGVVDAADYPVWRDNLGMNLTLPNEDPNTTPGMVTQEDYDFWKSRVGATSGTGSGSAAVPEPGSLWLLLVVPLLAVTNRPRRVMRVTVVISAIAISGTAQAATTNDREYRFGDPGTADPTFGANVGEGNPIGFSSVTGDEVGPSGGFQDLIVSGPTYTGVSDRPGAGGSDFGARFDGQDDVLFTPISMNRPTDMWDNTDFFPSTDPAAPDTFPLNYEGIFSHGIALWAKPDLTALGQENRQDLIMDTPEHAIVITETDNWGLLFDFAPVIDSGVRVAGSVDSNGWVHLMEVAGFSDPAGGGSAAGGVLYVNGIAVAARPDTYDSNDDPLSVGASVTLDGDGNLVEATNRYTGVLDDVQIFLWGDNTNQLGQENAPGGVNDDAGLNADGQNWGTFNLGQDNEFIALQLDSLGVTDDGDVNLDGSITAEDGTEFVQHWRKVNLVNGVQVGDWNTRQNGDLNYDGLVNLSDVLIVHNALEAATGSGFDFSLLFGNGVPEPTAGALMILGLGLLAAARCRRA